MNEKEIFFRWAGHIAKLVFGVVVAVIMILWVWLLEVHPTTRSLDATAERMVAQKVASLPYAEKELVRNSLRRCFVYESQGIQIPFKPKTVEVYGVFGGKSLSDAQVREVTGRLLEGCAVEFVREPTSVTEIRARMELLRQAGFEVDALGGTS